MSVFFNGQLLVTPVTASAVNDDAMLNQNLSVGNAIAYVGIADGGKPQTVLSFGTPDEARDVLGGGELCDAVVAAFSPSEETGSAQTVHAVRVNPTEPASLTVPAVPTAGAAVFAKFVAKKFSADDIQTRIKFEAGSATGLFNIRVEGKQKGQNWSQEGTDINMPGIHLEILTSDGSFGIGENTLTNALGWVSYGYKPDNSYEEVDLSQYRNFGEIADYLETVTDGQGRHVFKFTFDNDDYRELQTTDLDAGFHKGSGTSSLSWNEYSLRNWVEANVSDWLEVEFPLGAGNVDYMARHRGPDTSVPVKYLSRPIPVAPTMGDWTAAIDLLETKDVQWVHAVTGNPAIHAKIQSHVAVCSNVLRKERRAICGTVAGTSDEDALKAAKAINSKRVSLVHIGYYDYDARGKLALRPPYMTAGLVAAAFAGSNPGTPLTNKTLAVRGLERDLRNPTDTDKLLKGGVMPIENTENGYKVTQSITTWLGDSKYNNREQSCGVAIDFTIRNVRQAVDPLRGSKQSPLLLSRAVSLAESALKELARPEPQGPAVLVGDEKSPAYRNITASIEGDVLRLQFEASPAIPNNYILVTMYAVPYSGSATA